MKNQIIIIKKLAPPAAYDALIRHGYGRGKPWIRHLNCSCMGSDPYVLNQMPLCKPQLAPYCDLHTPICVLHFLVGRMFVRATSPIHVGLLEFHVHMDIVFFFFGGGGLAQLISGQV